MKVVVLPDSLVFEGVLDEETLPADLSAALSKLVAAGSKATVKLDLSKVSYCNSAGIMVWIRFLRASNMKFQYINAPIWLINQFNMIGEVLINGSFVSSFQAPYFCTETQESRSLTLELGKDLPVMQDYSSYTATNRIIEGKEYEPDYNPPRYFHFIAENFAQFKAAHG